MNFQEDVLAGLTSKPKHLSSRYFYDDEGSKLFQLIMKSPEYYLTNCEHAIFSKQNEAVVSEISKENKALRIIDLGAGDGSKTILLLKGLKKLGVEAIYTPVDISQEAIDEVERKVKKALPKTKIEPLKGEYQEALEKIDNVYKRLPKVILFLGSNIGNFNPENAEEFLIKLYKLCNPGDRLLIGFDLKKDPKVIRAAYDDKLGITARFNLNLLRRINRELGGEFDLLQFEHYNTYNPISGTARSYIMSKKSQKVYIKALDKTISFDPWEAIYVEQSQKYDLVDIQKLADTAKFTIEKGFFDAKKRYTDSLWIKK